MSLQKQAGTLELGSSAGLNPVTLSDVFVVKPSHMLPAGIVALLGVGDIHTLRISLDAVVATPGCVWNKAVSLSLFGRLRRAFRRCLI
jgi:hypothetical protein